MGGSGRQRLPQDQDCQAQIQGPRGRWNNAQGRGSCFALDGGRGRAPRFAKEGRPRPRHRSFAQENVGSWRGGHSTATFAGQWALAGRAATLE